jgi:hypothetical protein
MSISMPPLPLRSIGGLPCTSRTLASKLPNPGVAAMSLAIVASSTREYENVVGGILEQDVAGTKPLSFSAGADCCAPAHRPSIWTELSREI